MSSLAESLTLWTWFQGIDGVSIATSLSLVCLFCVLTLYKYEVLFRTGVIAVALLGLWSQFFYVLPYVFVLWRYYVGLNVTTELKMYIGRTVESEASDSSNTTNHWIVVVQQEGRYIYTHAVGNVVMGKGTPKHFKAMSQETLNKYTLTHVGYVTKVNRLQKMKELVENEPMRSGYTCQEFAVDIAFQLSGSRTFTFMRTLLLPRIRTAVFVAASVASVLLYFLNYSLGQMLNLAVVINLFVSMELARIGVHNQPQKSVLPVIKAYVNYPKKSNFLQLFMVSVVLLVMYARNGLLDTLIMLAAIVIASVNFQSM